MHLRRWIVIAMSCLGLASCVIGPKQEDPANAPGARTDDETDVDGGFSPTDATADTTVVPPPSDTGESTPDVGSVTDTATANPSPDGSVADASVGGDSAVADTKVLDAHVDDANAADADPDAAIDAPADSAGDVAEDASDASSDAPMDAVDADDDVLGGG